MNLSRQDMSSGSNWCTSDFLRIDNVTTRRRQYGPKSNMAHYVKGSTGLDLDGSILVDSILSQDEAHDIVSMMIMADEHDNHTQLPSFCTSTQMGGRNPLRRPLSPLLSPLWTPDPSGRAEPELLNMDYAQNRLSPERNRRPRTPPKDFKLNLKNSFEALEVSYDNGRDQRRVDGSPVRGAWESKNSREKEDREGRDPLTGGSGDVTMVSNHVTPDDVGDGVGDGVGETNDNNDVEQVGQRAGLKSGSSGMSADLAGDGADQWQTEGEARTSIISLAAKLTSVDELVAKIDKRSITLSKTVRDLEDSLTFSQNQIDDLKKENLELRKQVGAIEMEDRRTQFQVSTVESKLDKIETASKKKNLLIDGIPEVADRREDVEKTVGDLFDQLSVREGINFDACFRVGPFIKHRVRPILVAFERQSDRDLIYEKRFDLKRTKDYQKIWVNEDMGALSKRKRGLIRLITKEAQQQGVDCCTGKYSITIDKKRYDDDNIQDLPSKLHPTQLKQVQIDEGTLAYQSEFAPFSNFYACKVNVGSHTFFCLEQAFQFLRAKILDKPLEATRIYLSRDVYYIKRAGNELGTSDIWESRKFDVMLQCLKKKFEQNEDLRALLLKSGDLELVEATPDRLWGCGATLSSNVIRQHAWPGQNKHGQLLMAVREELRKERI